MKEVRKVTARDDGAARLPNLLIGGVAKAGTTSLFRYLAQHPEVCPSSVKEARYFSAIRYGEPLPPLEGYARLFAHTTGERYRMEATPGYYPGGRPVADAVRETLSDPQVVVCFRDPIQRCYSWYRFVRSTARIPKGMGFPAYLDRCEQLHRSGVDHHREHQPYWGVGGGCYDRWIADWLDVFGTALRIVYFEDLTADPHAVIEDLCGRLGIDTGVCAGFRYDIENRTVQYRNRGLQRVALAVNRTGERVFGQHPALKRTLRGAYYRINADSRPEHLDSASLARLAAFYAPHNDLLRSALIAAGRDRLPAWLDPAGEPHGRHPAPTVSERSADA